METATRKNPASQRFARGQRARRMRPATTKESRRLSFPLAVGFVDPKTGLAQPPSFRAGSVSSAYFVVKSRPRNCSESFSSVPSARSASIAWSIAVLSDVLAFGISTHISSAFS